MKKKNCFQRIRLVYYLCSCLLLSAQIQAQQITVSGRIVNEIDGLPISNANISIKGTAKGTVSDEKGDYKIEVPSRLSVLVISFIGYQTKEIPVGNQTKINVQLVSSSAELNQVVVVGYATQRKVNLTGSVSTVNARDLENRPVTNVSSALAGLIPGVSVRQSSGRPGEDEATIRIHGNGTLSSSSPLVLIDGIQGDIDAVNPLDIESISILKDAASASIYGTLASNGVILITTKKGSSNKTSITYNAIFSTTRPTNIPSFVTDYARHMELINEAYSNVGQPTIFAQSTIDAWRAASADPNGVNALGVPNYLAYPNTDWAAVLFSDKILQNHNLSVSGGNDKSNYMLSIGFLDNPGIIDRTGSKRYQIRANVESKIGKLITVGMQTFASHESLALGNTEDAFTYLRSTTPGLVPEYQGRYGFPQAPEESSTANNVLAWLNNTGGNNKTSRFSSTLYAKLNLYKGLTLETRANYQTRFNEKNTYPNAFERWNFADNEIKVTVGPPTTSPTTYSFNKDYHLIFDDVLRYSGRIGTDHEIGGLVGFNQTYFNYYDFSATKTGLIDPSITTLSSAAVLNAISGQEYDNAIRSFFGRLNYSYKQRYLIEANFRRDASSKFSEQNRNGFFPSFSAGWRITEEGFMENYKRNFGNLKLRVSYGQTGNQLGNSLNYDYQATYSSVSYSFNNAVSNAVAAARFSNPDLRWETSTTANIGLDASFFRNKLNFEFDIYKRTTKDILTTPPVPLTVGTGEAPYYNTASVLNRGIDINIKWQGNAGEVKYAIGSNFSYVNNTIEKYKGKLEEGYVTDASGNKVYVSNLGTVSTSSGNTRILEGHEISEYYLLDLYKGDGTYHNSDGSLNIQGGPKDGMIRTPDDLAWVQSMIAAGYSFLPGNGIGKAKIWYGDLLYADRNGDGVYGNSFDYGFTGASSTPKFNFGLTANVSWRGFDFSMLWAGSAGLKYYWSEGGYNSPVLRNGFAISARIADNRYYYNDADPSDPKNNINGSITRFKIEGDAQNSVASTYRLYDGSYVKLKNLQIGYTLAEKLTKRVAISRARIYFTAENLLLITNYPGLDPEIGANVSYPTVKQFAFGVNISL